MRWSGWIVLWIAERHTHPVGSGSDAPGVDRRIIVGPGQAEDGRGADGNVNGEVEATLTTAPVDPRGSVWGVVPDRAVAEPAAGAGCDGERAVAGGEGGEAADDAVQVVGDGAECVVVERGHVARVDAPVGEHGVPPLPGRGRTH